MGVEHEKVQWGVVLVIEWDQGLQKIFEKRRSIEKKAEPN